MSLAPIDSTSTFFPSPSTTDIYSNLLEPATDSNLLEPAMKLNSKDITHGSASENKKFVGKIIQEMNQEKKNKEKKQFRVTYNNK